MGEPALSPPAMIARTFDPDLFHAALFAREPARERLMVLTALDIELSRAVDRRAGREEGPLIARMRLQFWRDVLNEAADGAPARAHEIAAPLHALVEGPLGTQIDRFHRLIDAREAELEGIPDRPAFDAWADARFGSFLRLAVQCCGVKGARGETAAAHTGRTIAIAFALRTARARAADGAPALLPGVDADTEAVLAEGAVSPLLADIARGLAADGLAACAAARRLRAGVPTRAVPAFLPLWRAERELTAVLRNDGNVLRAIGPAARPMRTAAYAFRSATGRW